MCHYQPVKYKACGHTHPELVPCSVGKCKLLYKTAKKTKEEKKFGNICDDKWKDDSEQADKEAMKRYAEVFRTVRK